MLATLAETKAALRIDHDDDDATLNLLIGAASGSVQDYLKADSFDVVPDRVRLAVIMLVKKLFDEDADAFKAVVLPPVVLSLLHSLRAPTIR